MSSALHLPRTPPSKHTLKLLVGPVIFLVICSNVASVMWPTLSEDHPLILIMLSSTNRFLLLVSDRLDPVSYYVVGTMRLLVSDPLFFLLGYWYGDKALEWLDRKSPTYGPFLRKAQGAFGKAAWLLVMLAPNNYICLFAGAAGMRVSLFFALNLIGTVARLYSLRVVGDVFSGPLDSVQDFIGQYQWQLIAVSALLVAWTVRGEMKGGGQIDQLRTIDDDFAPENLADLSDLDTGDADGGRVDDGPVGPARRWGRPKAADNDADQ